MSAQSVSAAPSARDPFQRLSDMTRVEQDQVKNLFHYYSMQRLLRTTGWLNIFLGLLTLWLGISHTRQTVEKYAYCATYAEIMDNDYNLNIPRYVDTFEQEEAIDLRAVNAEI